VAASTQNQAIHAVLLLYKEVLKQDLDLKVDAVRAKKSNYLPTVLTKDEVLAIIQKLSGVYQLLIKLLYGTGLFPRFKAGLEMLTPLGLIGTIYGLQIDSKHSSH